jgi:hypothetical protein
MQPAFNSCSLGLWAITPGWGCRCAAWPFCGRARASSGRFERCSKIGREGKCLRAWDWAFSGSAQNCKQGRAAALRLRGTAAGSEGRPSGPEPRVRSERTDPGRTDSAKASLSLPVPFRGIRTPKKRISAWSNAGGEPPAAYWDGSLEWSTSRTQGTAEFWKCFAEKS